MTIDGITLRAITHELQDKIIGAKVQKIGAPSPFEVLLNLYQRKDSSALKLYLSANSSCPRIHLTEKKYTNPQTPPAFCMVLRKHLGGATIQSIKQHGMDRVIFIDFETYNELGDQVTLTLVVELMGKYSNIILINEHAHIIDSIRRVTFDMSRIRQVLPGSKYFPMADEKISILEDETLPSTVVSQIDKSVAISKLFYQHYTGFSPVIGKELCFLEEIPFGTSTDQLSSDQWISMDLRMKELIHSIRENRYSPTLMISESREKKDFYCFPLSHLAATFESNISISAIIDDFYATKGKQDQLEQKSGPTKKIVLKKLRKLKEKKLQMMDDLMDAKEREKYKIYADLLMAHAHDIQKGSDQVILENFYSPTLEEISIPLDIRKSPWENAQKYYKQFSKKKTAEKRIREELPKVDQEIAYLSQVEDSLCHITQIEELEEIREELYDEGLLRRTKKKKVKEARSKPHSFISTEGFTILVGKNNRQNDEITMKEANRNDVFFHVKNYAGSHVIVRSNGEWIGDETILQAAFLAAYYSSANSSPHVEVDYTEKGNVKKPRSAKPGLVYYEAHETVMVDPTDLALKSKYIDPLSDQ